MLSYPRPMTSGGSSGEASLDGDAPASAQQRHPRASIQSRSPDAGPGEAPARAWWSFDRSSSALGLPMTAFSTAHRDRCLASDVLCCSHRTGPDFTPDPRHAARFHLHRRLIKDDGLAGTRTPSFDECCLLRSGLRRASRPSLAYATHGRKARNHRQPGTGAAVSPPRGRLPAPFHHPSTRLDGQTQADSWASLRLAANEHLDRTPLIEFCNQNSPRARPCDRSIPGAHVRGSASSLRWTWREPPDGVGAPAATSTIDSG